MCSFISVLAQVLQVASAWFFSFIAYFYLQMPLGMTLLEIVLDNTRGKFEIYRFLKIGVDSQAYEFVFASVSIASEQDYIWIVVIPRHQITT